MIRFECDYLEGAHPKILEALSKSNYDQTPGYSKDVYCEEARNLIKTKCGCEDADVHFFVGGTQTNKTVITSILRPYQGVLCADSGHINVHETGAIESTGHKVLSLKSTDGKITAEQVRKAYEEHYVDGYEHCVQPGMVYISYPTEIGTLYSKEELTSLSKTCRELNLPLFLDGARLGYGLTAEGSNLTLSDIANLCDVFYIGATKVGALFGEAAVIVNDNLKKDFIYYIKQNGGLIAKGRLLGIQFVSLFEDDLYFKISKHANKMALKIKDAFIKKGYSLFIDSNTNQQFPIIPNDKLKVLGEKYSFTFWEKADENNSVVRFCTSWATKEEYVECLIKDIENL